MADRIFIWVAHPGAGSFNAAIADAYQRGAQASGAQVRRMDLADMRFSAAFDGYDGAPELEGDIQAWQQAVQWADHILIVHPCWWGAMPARAKDLLDRGLTSGFAYKYRSGPGIKWDKLLEGRTADTIITADTPPWLDSLLYLGSWRRLLKKQLFEFCGIRPRKVAMFGSVKLSDLAKRQAWLARAEAMGASAAGRRADRVAAPAQGELNPSRMGFSGS